MLQTLDLRVEDLRHGSIQQVMGDNVLSLTQTMRLVFACSREPGPDQDAALGTTPIV